MKILVENDLKGKSNYVTKIMLECQEFWNREGKTIFKQNIAGDLGSKETNEFARKTQYDDWLLEMLLCDCKGMCNSTESTVKDINFECGRNRSHVWVHMENERILMFYVK